MCAITRAAANTTTKRRAKSTTGEMSPADAPTELLDVDSSPNRVRTIQWVTDTPTYVYTPEYQNWIQG